MILSSSIMSTMKIDTRIQSQAMDGVPDEIINNIARQLVKIARENQQA